MSIASTVPCEVRQPTGIDRLAQQLGLALVAWGERGVSQRSEPEFDAVQQHAVEQLMNDRALSVSSRRAPLF